MAAGASALSRRLPSRPRTAAVATMTLEGSGLAAPGLSSSSEAGGVPCAASARHITGSQDTVAARLTWPATQAAARSRIAIPVPAPARLPAPAVACRASTNASTPASAISTITPLIMARRRRACRRNRCGDVAGCFAAACCAAA